MSLIDDCLDDQCNLLRTFLYQCIQACPHFITYLLVNVNKRDVIKGVNYLLKVFWGIFRATEERNEKQTQLA